MLAMQKTKAMTKIIEILLRWVDSWLRKNEARKHQNEYKDIQDDPAMWMRSHFNSVSDSNAKTSSKTNTK